MNRAWVARAALLAAGIGAAYVMQGKAPVDTDVTVQLERKPTSQVSVTIATLDHVWISTAKYPVTDGGRVALRPHLAPGSYLLEIEVETEAGPRVEERRILLDGNAVTVFGPRQH